MNINPRRLGALAALAIALAAPQASAATYRWAGSSNRVYIENGGTATLSELKAALPIAPVVLVDEVKKIWLVSANIVVLGGTTLNLHGTSVGGDVNEMRLKSDAGSAFVYISAEPGNVDIASTKITSWNTSTNQPDAEYATGRAFIRVRSLMGSDGVTPLESRMDIVDSEIQNLGYNAAESYGLVWKVLGGDTDFSMYDKVNVRGDIKNSHIHHNYYGVYTFGMQTSQWLNNEIDHNVGYGFDPHDDSDDLLIDSNNVHDNGFHGIIASKRCDHVVIKNNHSWNNAECGIMLHRSSDHGSILNNRSEDNGDCGIALFATNDTLVRGNTLARNANAGLRLSMGSTSAQVESNEIDHSGRFGIYFYRGTDTPEPGSDGRNRDNVFTNNNIHDSQQDGIKMSESDDNSFIGNTLSNNGTEIQFVSSTNTVFSNNTLQQAVATHIEGTPTVPSVVKFSEQPRVALNLDTNGAASFTDVAGAVFDSGIGKPTVITHAGSALHLDSTDADSTVVFTRDFTARPDSGSISVTPLVWQVSAAHSKSWTAVAPPNVRVVYTVGDLVPGQAYDVFRARAKIRTITASPAGRIRFATAVASTAARKFTVKPAAP